MINIKIKIEGVSPLLINRFTDAAAEKATKQTGSSITGDQGTPKELAEVALYKDNDGVCIIPQPNIFRCIMDAGKYFKVGKKQVTTAKTSFIPGCVTINGVGFKIQHKEPWTIDTRPIRNPSTGGRFLKHRPCFHDWAIEFEVELDEEILGQKLFREIVDAAGKRVGLCDFRPDCKGPFGRFVVTKWKAKKL